MFIFNYKLYIFIKMGSGNSKRTPILSCPPNYDPEKFKTICQLFDRLDKDSNMGVGREEIGDVAKLHVENRVRLIGEQKTFRQNEKVFKLQQIEDQGQQKISLLQASIATEKGALEQEFQNKQQAADKEISWLNSLDQTGQTEEFLKVLKTKDGENIDFWNFFEYMKNKTPDIKNINHT